MADETDEYGNPIEVNESEPLLEDDDVDVPKSNGPAYFLAGALVLASIALIATFAWYSGNTNQGVWSVQCLRSSLNANCSTDGTYPGYPCNPDVNPARTCKGLDQCNPLTETADNNCGNGTCAFNATYLVDGYFACTCRVYNYPDPDTGKCVYKFP